MPEVGSTIFYPPMMICPLLYHAQRTTGAMSGGIYMIRKQKLLWRMLTLNLMVRKIQSLICHV